MPPLDEQLVYDVVQLDKQRMKWRALARALHLSRNTVRQIVVGHGHDREQPHPALPLRRVIPRPSKLDSFRTEIDDLLKKYSDITAQRVFEILREKGFAGGYTGVKDLVRRIRPMPLPTPSLETPPRLPGALAEHDWSQHPVAFRTPRR